LAALGFCDESAVGLSSVYFVFSQKFASRSLGIYSVLRECHLAREMGLRWYFLGFYVRGNSTMAYKGRFFPRQILDWQSGEWSYRED
jgi:arginine-tRNA-protein transferase